MGLFGFGKNSVEKTIKKHQKEEAKRMKTFKKDEYGRKIRKSRYGEWYVVFSSEEELPNDIPTLEKMADGYRIDFDKQTCLTIVKKILEIDNENLCALNLKSYYEDLKENHKKFHQSYILRYDSQKMDTRFRIIDPSKDTNKSDKTVWQALRNFPLDDYLKYHFCTMDEYIEWCYQRIELDKRNNPEYPYGLLALYEALHWKALGIEKCTQDNIKDFIFAAQDAGDPYVITHYCSYDYKRIYIDSDKEALELYQYAAQQGIYNAAYRAYLEEKKPMHPEKYQANLNAIGFNPKKECLRILEEARQTLKTFSRDRFDENIVSQDIIDKMNKFWAEQNIKIEEALKSEEQKRIEAENLQRREPLFKQGVSVYMGMDPTKSKQDGLDMIIEASEIGHEPALAWLIRHYAENGNKDAQYLMGNCVFNGLYGIQKDELAAYEWYQKASNQGHAQAYYQMAQYYLCGYAGLMKNADMAVKMLEKSSDAGYLGADLALGDYYSSKENHQAESCYKKVIASKNNDEETDMLKKKAYQGLFAFYMKRDGYPKAPYANLEKYKSLLFEFIDKYFDVERYFDDIPKAKRGEANSLRKLAGCNCCKGSISRVLYLLATQSYEALAKQGDRKAYGPLYDLYKDKLGNYDAFIKLGEMGIKERIPELLYLVALDADWFGLTDGEAMNCLRQAAQAGHQYAKSEYEHRQWLMKQEREEEQMIKNYQNSQREKALDEKLDTYEREMNLFLNGEYATDFERSLTGKMSYQDYARSTFLRDAYKKKNK